MVRIKRAYDAPEPSDGDRVLVDRLWPRGVKREEARLEAWRKDLAPSPALRVWFGHDPARFEEFRKRYREEVAREPGRSLLGELRRRASAGTVTLVYGARDPVHNGAVVLKSILDSK